MGLSRRCESFGLEMAVEGVSAKVWRLDESRRLKRVLGSFSNSSRKQGQEELSLRWVLSPLFKLIERPQSRTPPQHQDDVGARRFSR